MVGRWFCAVATMLIGMTASMTAKADDSSITRDDGGRTLPSSRVRVDPMVDGTLTAALVGITAGATLVAPRSDHLYGGVLVDEEARDALRVQSEDGRKAVRTASDVGLALAISAPLLVDTFVVSWMHRGDPRLARDLALVGGEALALTGALQGITNTMASRERPYGRLCGTEISATSEACVGSGRYRSFFSGHSTISFAGAGVLCANHIGLRLLGGPWDAIVCGMGVAVASTTAIFRVAGDMHYLSDIAVGAGVGAGIGLLVPLLHFTDNKQESRGFAMRLTPMGNGAGISGTF